MRVAVLLAVRCGVGCTNLSYRPPAGGPPSPALAAAAGDRVTLADHRPDWERRPFDNGRALLDLDALAPDPWAAVRREAEAAVGPAGGPTAAVRVLSYRVVTHIVGGPEAEWAEFGLGANAPAALRALWTLVIQAPARRGYRREVCGDPPGANCTLVADVTLAWPDGRRRVSVVSVARNVATVADAAHGHKTADTARAVAEAAADFGRQVRELVQAGPGP